MSIRLRNHIFIMVTTLFILWGGFYLSSIQFLGKEWLSRSGSIVVVFGIMLGFSAIIQERIQLSRLEIRRRIELLQKKRKLRLLKADPQFVAKELADIEAKFEEQEELLIHSIKFSIGLAEGVLLIFGTLVWGFGDIIIQLVC